MKIRNRFLAGGIFIGAIMLGLASRRFAMYLPEWNRLYLGDAIWAFMVYWLFATILAHKKPMLVGVVALVFSFCIEFSQLYQADWINTLRANRLAALVLGRGFLWSDLGAYSIGIALAFFVDICCITESPTDQSVSKKSL